MEILSFLLFAVIIYSVSKIVEKLRQGYQLKIASYGKMQKNGQNKGIESLDNGGDSTAAGRPSDTNYQLVEEIEPVTAITHATLPLAASAPPLLDEKAVWSGKMTKNAVINGVIFAEIIQPPRAYRPFVHRK